MKSKLRTHFQWGSGKKNNGAFPTKQTNATSAAAINISPVTVRAGALNLDAAPVIHTSNNGNCTVSTLSNDRGAFSQKRFNCGFDDDDRTTLREQMWYKNQSYLKKQAERGGVSFNVTSSYASDKRWRKDDNEDEGSDAPESPVAVNELDSFHQRQSLRSESESQQSRSLMDAAAADFASVYEDDGTRSTFFYSDDVNTNFEDVSLGGTLETATWASVTRYEMTDAERSSKKYKLGCGTTSIKQGSYEAHQRTRSMSHTHRRSYSLGDASSANDNSSIRCQEWKGTIEDVSLTFKQILNAFYISPDDIDKMSDRIRDAGCDWREYRTNI